MNEFDRTIRLIGTENFNKLTDTTVLLVGLGGVGGYAFETLVRVGIGNIIIIDYDIIDITNLNRQIVTNYSNIGYKKTDEYMKRAKSINSSCNIIKLDMFLNKDNIYELDNYKIDYVIDACDTIDTKKILIKWCFNNNIDIISCMGTGNKLHPELLKITDIKDTSYDPIAKIIRKYLKSESLNKKLMVISSMEEPIVKDKVITSISFVPATAGLLCVSYVINKIIS